MKKIKLFIGILIIGMLTSLGSCTKFGKNITVEGKVLNPITGKGISGVEIWLLKTTMGLPGGDKDIKTIFSDENGNFELNKFSFRADRIRIGNMHGDYYEVGWYKDGKYETHGGTMVIKKGKTIHADFHAVPYGEYRINLNNINCHNVNDTIIIRQQNEVKSLLDIDWILTGCDGYTTSWDKVPMGNIHTKYTVIRNNVANTYEVDFMVHPNQNNEQVINY